jgi:type IV pilus assembly protein PilO
MTHDRRLVAAVGALAVIGLWFLLVWTPRTNAITSAHTRTEAADTSAQQLRLQLSRLTAAKRDGAASTAVLQHLTVAVPDTPDLAGLLLAVNDTANAAGVHLAGVTPGSVAAGTPTAIPFSLNVSGSYFGVVSFVQHLTSLPRIVVLDGVQVSAGANDSTLTVALTARAFTTQGVAR